MGNLVNVLAIQQLDGGTYTVDTVLKVIKQITDWALAVGIALAGVALVISFIMYAVVDVDQKPRVKTRIVQTLLGIGGIIMAISLVNIIIRLFS
ncbi:MAG: hypothetical protein IJO32_05345 [Bacilli bacterium]|nr:hypothetical protein [Bacilli bacterium]